MGLMLDLQPSVGPALVIGGGTVAARKVSGLVEAGFAVDVIATTLVKGVQASGVSVQERPFADSDLPGDPRFAVVFACTDDRAVNRHVGELARSHGIPVVVADEAAESTAFTPAVLRDGVVTVAVSTGGLAPRVAAAARDQVRDALGAGWGEVAITSGAARREGRTARP